MIRRFVVIFTSLLLLAGAGSALAATFSLLDGGTLTGEPISFNLKGTVIKKPDGTFAPRMGWTNFTQEALQILAKLPKAKAFVEPYLEVDEAEEEVPRLVITPKAHDRLERPDLRAGWGTIFDSPVTVVLFLILFAGNIYAAYEIATFRNYHPALVCGIAVVLPVVTPIVFLCLPTYTMKTQDELAAESMAEHLAETPPHTIGAGLARGVEEEEAAAEEEAHPRVTVYQRGQTTFNRRFFETKFAGFVRPVPGEEEEGKEIFVRSARGEHVGNRLTRVQPNEIHLQVMKGDATADVIIPFNEIYEVQVRPREG